MKLQGLSSLFLVIIIAVQIGASAKEVKQYTIEDLLDTTGISGASFSPDGKKLLITSNETGISNVYALPIDGGDPIPLTASTSDPIYGNGYFPNDERFIFRRDEGGNELTQIFVQTPDGDVTNITPEEGAKASFAGWAKDDQSFFLVSNSRDPKYFDLYEVDATTYVKKMLFKNETGYNFSDISDDKRYVALAKPETDKNNYAFIHDLKTGETREIMAHEGVEAVCRPQDFSPDGKSIHCLTDQGQEFLYLLTEDLETGESKILEKLDWDIRYAYLSKSGRYLVMGINSDSISEVKILDTETGNALPLPDMGDLSISSISFSKDEASMAFYVQGGRTPGDLYYHTFGSSSRPTQLTNRLSPKIDPEDLVAPEIVRFDSYDGTVIPGILYKPHQASAENKVPALVYVHGGPGGQTRATYTPLIQYLVNHGYAVYGINNRGSSGYGKTFYAMDDLKHGNADLDDCVASKQMLIDTGYVDPKRIGIIGGSYGGYMVCAALAFRPEEFEVGVNIFGVTNWLRTLKSIPAWWEASRNALYKELGDPFTQEDYLKKISPLFHAENIVKPMIVLQGKNDPRVLQVESDEMVAAVKANDVPVNYVVFDDEGHGFRKKKNQIVGYKAILEFVDEHLKSADL